MWIYLNILVTIYIVQGYQHDITIITASKSKVSLNNNMIQTVLSKHQLINPSLELAIRNCQSTFKWDRWNCPRSDFITKRKSKNLDRESAFVSALTTAALIYTITKTCSSGEFPGCGCSEYEKNQLSGCSDDPEYAEQIVDNLLNSESSGLDAQGYAELHNKRAAQIAVKKSMRKYCRCKPFFSKNCDQEICWTTIRPFEEITRDLRQMYDKALLVKVDNTGAMNWNQIPENTLVFVHESLNYCKVNVIPGWNGMIGRQCSRERSKSSTIYERKSCRQLCRYCGLRVKERTIMTEKRCNCKFSWCCDVTCDICAAEEKQFYCI